MKEITDSKADPTDCLIFAIDETKAAVLALNVLDDHLAKVSKEPLYWQWALLALHDAIQGFMVANLAGYSKLNIMRDARSCHHCGREVTTMICPGCSNEIEVLKVKRTWGTRSEWADYYRSPSYGHEEESEPLKPYRLIDFTEMWGRIQKDKYMADRLHGAKKFQPTKKQSKSVLSLHNDIRNEFVHFRANSLLDYTPELLSVVKDILPIISFLAFESGIIKWFGPKSELRNTTRELLERLNDRVAALEKTYNDEISMRSQLS
jgi:hypothetical protein